MSRESYIEEKVCERAKARGWLVRKIAYLGRRNAPDRHFYRAGRLLIIEFKAPGEKPRKGQDREHRKLREAGFEVYVIDSVESGYDLVD